MQDPCSVVLKSMYEDNYQVLLFILNRHFYCWLWDERVSLVRGRAMMCRIKFWGYWSIIILEVKILVFTKLVIYRTGKNTSKIPSFFLLYVDIKSNLYHYWLLGTICECKVTSELFNLFRIPWRENRKCDYHETHEK